MKLITYHCDECDSEWEHLYQDDERRTKSNCPKCEKAKHQPYSHQSKHFDCVTSQKAKGCGYSFASNEKDAMYLSCPNCQKNLAKRRARVTHVKNAIMAKATELAYSQAQAAGFTDMRDTNLRIGDVSAPPINNAVTYAQNAMGMKDGWSGSGNYGIPSGRGMDTGAISVMNSMNKNLSSGSIKDPLKTNLVREPK